MVTITRSNYLQTLAAVKAADPTGFWSVSIPSQAQLDHGTLIATEHGACLVTCDGDICGLFKLPESTARGVAADLLALAVAAGGRTLDNFDGHLTRIYTAAGFRVVSRCAFSVEHAPDGWSAEAHGWPDVVAMLYDPAGDVVSRSYTCDDYDTMISVRNNARALQQLLGLD